MALASFCSVPTNTGDLVEDVGFSRANGFSYQLPIQTSVLPMSPWHKHASPRPRGMISWGGEMEMFGKSDLLRVGKILGVRNFTPPPQKKKKRKFLEMQNAPPKKKKQPIARIFQVWRRDLPPAFRARNRQQQRHEQNA